MKAGAFDSFLADLADLEVAYLDRVADANHLHSGGRHASAIVMALYALEIKLKVGACRRLDLDKLPAAFAIHDFNALLIVSGLSRLIDDPSAAPVKKNWDHIVITFSGKHVNELRYGPDSNWTRADADDLLKRLQDPQDGVLTWLSNQI